MDGVDLTDRMVRLRNPTKWRKKVFFKLLMISVVNANALYVDLHRKKSLLILFLNEVAELLIAMGRQKAK
ncbi:hypothetical protein HHI36_009507, partial [Cryptolaemus montrouzieri]